MIKINRGTFGSDRDGCKTLENETEYVVKAKGKFKFFGDRIPVEERQKEDV